MSRTTRSLRPTPGQAIEVLYTRRADGTFSARARWAGGEQRHTGACAASVSENVLHTLQDVLQADIVPEGVVREMTREEARVFYLRTYGEESSVRLDDALRDHGMGSADLCGISIGTSQLRCANCKRITAIEPAGIKPGEATLTPDGWDSLEVQGAGFVNGFAHTCPACVDTMVAFTSYLTARCAEPFVADVEAAVAKISELAEDSEAAHEAEDGLYEQILRAAADGLDIREAAAVALRTKDLKFERWCS